MDAQYFKSPLFEAHSQPVAVPAVHGFYFCNRGGTPSYEASYPGDLKELIAEPVDPLLQAGRPHTVASVHPDEPPFETGFATRLEFAEARVVYPGLLATPEIARAFGMVLVQQDECIRVPTDGKSLQYIEYEYGIFAGHYFPYRQQTPAGEPGIPLSGKVCTDLEHHAFPHVFASIDPDLPLVISAARYWPEDGRICLADLWVEPGHALFVPPRPACATVACIDMHNNRNSALACRDADERMSIVTHTLLARELTGVHWYWNGRDTEHLRPQGIFSQPSMPA